jgi:hypothetical protein
MKPYNRIKELKEAEAEEAMQRQARPNHNPVVLECLTRLAKK